MNRIEHEHDYVTQLGDEGRPTSFGACTVCGELPPAVCAVCGWPTPSARPIHDACLEREQAVLEDVSGLLADVPEPARSILTAVAYDLAGVTAGSDPERLPFGLDAVTDDWFHHAAGIRTTHGAVEVLQEWVRAWGDAGAGTPAVAAPVEYLRSRLVWAATNPDRSGFEDYRREVRTVRGRLQFLAGLPVETGGRCITCHTQAPLVREWTPSGLDDVARCQVCGDTYDTTRLLLAQRQRVRGVPSTRPDALVTEPEARRIFVELGSSTIRLWIHRGHLEAAGKRRGSATYRVGDIARLAGYSDDHVDASTAV
ncbi:MAG: hypothetical protein J0H73_14290 [Salana multivorans]|uniref:hypothetical protein n=1 Tax=Salana multivorans TaxID=120377 RepID=UPI0009651C75|nr:hypothetical protein [Salana multivorans]MBN8883470.1 hypothetical protein [Salana multivorans]OJX98660.1 MAG: hypothetical protein BGO96_04590 [Micrococcales bacterium 73-15]